MSDYDSEDSHKVSVDFPIVNSEDERRVEKKMADACREGLYWELGLTSYFKLNLNNSKGTTYNSQPQTYFACTTQRARVLVRYDTHLKLQHAGRYTRARQFRLFDAPLPYTPAPTIGGVALEPPPPAKAYKMQIDLDTNIISSHPFTESQMKFTYGFVNEYQKAFKKNEKLALRNREFKIKLHGISESYDGMLLRYVTSDTAHYFKCNKPGEGKSGHWSVFTIEFGELKKWSPKKHLPKLKEIAEV